MKKRLSILAVVLSSCIAALAGVAAWRIGDIAVRYKPIIQEQLSAAVGVPVHIGKISASLFPEPSLVVTEVHTGDSSQGKPEIRVAELSARAALLPLLSGRLLISSLKVLSPEITVVREPTGVHVRGIQRSSTVLPASPPAQALPGERPLSPLNIQLDQIVVSNGSLKLEDSASGKVSLFNRISLESRVVFTGSRLDIPAAKLWLTAPEEISIEASADSCSFDTSTQACLCTGLTIFTPAGSLLLQGDYRPHEGTGSLRVTSNDLALERLQQAVKIDSPGLDALDLSGSARLALDVEVRESKPYVKNGKVSLKGFQVSPSRSLRITDGAGEVDIQGSLTDASLTASSMRFALNSEPLTVSSKLRLQSSQVVVDSLSLQGFRGSAELPLVITTPPRPITLRGRQSASGLSLEALLKAIRPGKSPDITGTLSSLQSEVSSLALDRPDQITVGASLVIKDGSIVGFNLPSLLMAKFSELPFISDSLQRKIPKQFEPLFSRPDTPIRELSLTGRVERGQASLSSISLTSDLFDLTGSGTYSLQGELSMTCNAILNRELSNVLVDKAPELKALRNGSDRLVVPLTIKGTFPAVAVLPDLAKIAGKTSGEVLQRALQDGLKGGKGLGKGLRKVFGF